MKVPLFLGFGDILMLKIKSQKPQLWGFGDQRAMTQITWDQVTGSHFGPNLIPVELLLKSKKN